MWKADIGKLMYSLKAFRGSKPLFETDNLLMVKGVCRDTTVESHKNIKDYLIEKLKQEGFEIVEDVEEIDTFVSRINEIFKENPIFPDTFGFEKMKESFEMIGCNCDYAIAKKGNIMVGISMYFDKKIKNPKFIEVLGVLIPKKA
ncbi:conserved hypothetical protein [Methanocaldococcus vulcanius M7]|uniref:Uncharacterized protein n=1 Tax=Methanocaldococcus vulcanius (strain ATCC 700851 / DSM 12094 / M7) TaxID=579137 RepID=C9RF75_METVM|nr:DUF2120 family protein [Methanocaldococcus vulcanius]ACX72227.1 conserved hypothetical protein [Methanocaldococcus vulcanius M7]